MGTMSLFWNIGTLDGKQLRAGMMGGAGLNTMTSNYIRKYGLEKEDRRSAFADSLKRCREEQVDVLIGNHVDQNDMVKKYPLLRAGQTDIFVDSSAWGAFLDLSENRLAKLLADDPM
jgi:metallo-beta-lactamase class B